MEILRRMTFGVQNFFDFLATSLVRGEGGNGKGGASMSNRCGIWLGWGTVAGVIAGVKTEAMVTSSGISDRGAFWSVTEVLLGSQRKTYVFHNQLMCVLCVFLDTGTAEIELFSDLSGEESRIKWVSEEKLVVTGIISFEKRSSFSRSLWVRVISFEVFQVISVLWEYSDKFSKRK